jgi:hypothetical protein
LDLGPLSSRVGLAAAFRMARTAVALPWPGRSRSRSHWRGTPPPLTATGTPFHKPHFARALEGQPRTPCSPPPMALAGLRRVPRRDAPVAAKPYPSSGASLARARCLAHAVAHAFARPRTGKSRQHRRRAPHRRRPHRDGHHPRSCALLAQQPKGVPCGCPVLSGHPSVVGLATGEVVPRRQLFLGNFVKHLGPLLKARVRDSARVATCWRGHNLSTGIRCG